MQAAILRVRLRHLDHDNQRRRTIAAYYDQQIDNPHLTLPVQAPVESNVWHIYPLLCSRRDELQDFLLRKGVQTQVHYPIPPHQQKCMSEWNGLSLPITEKIHAEELSLPIGPELTDDEMAMVVDAINEFD